MKSDHPPVVSVAITYSVYFGSCKHDASVMLCTVQAQIHAMPLFIYVSSSWFLLIEWPDGHDRTVFFPLNPLIPHIFISVASEVKKSCRSESRCCWSVKWLQVWSTSCPHCSLRPAAGTISLRFCVCSIRMSQSLGSAGSPAVPEEIWLFAGLHGNRRLVLLLCKKMDPAVSIAVTVAVAAAPLSLRRPPTHKRSLSSSTLVRSFLHGCQKEKAPVHLTTYLFRSCLREQEHILQLLTGEDQREGLWLQRN